MALNIKDLCGNSDKRFKQINTRQNVPVETRAKKKSLKSQWIGKITKQQAKTSKFNTVSCILLNILQRVFIYFIPIQILYIHGHFKLRNIKLHVLTIKLTHSAWAACGSPTHNIVLFDGTEKEEEVDYSFILDRTSRPTVRLISSQKESNPFVWM